MSGAHVIEAYDQRVNPSSQCRPALRKQATVGDQGNGQAGGCGYFEQFGQVEPQQRLSAPNHELRKTRGSRLPVKPGDLVGTELFDSRWTCFIDIGAPQTGLAAGITAAGDQVTEYARAGRQASLSPERMFGGGGTINDHIPPMPLSYCYRDVGRKMRSLHAHCM